MLRSAALSFALLFAVSTAARAQSVFTTRLDDPAAVYLDAPAFGAKADGVADDSAALQAAIDKAAATLNGGVLFVPSGRYRITRTIYLWRAVRVFGYGATRPVIVLGPNTPGYQKGLALMVMFSNAGPPGGGRAGGPGRGGPPRVAFSPPGQVPSRDDVPDASPVTFYSAISNVDVEIGDGNPAAVAIRFHVAQHGYLSHMNLNLGSGLAGLMQVGNEVDDLHFTGGRYGIITENTSPFWQFTAIDSTFDGQRDAAIREHMVQLTLIHDRISNVPVAVDVDPDYADQVWVKDSTFENVSKAVIQISNEKNPSTQIGFENVVCSRVPVFARFRESGRTTVAPGPAYRIVRFNYGLVVTDDSIGRFDTLVSTEMLHGLSDPLHHTALAPLPPASEWVNVHTLGVKGDGKADDTAAIEQAIAQHRVLYFPLGYYIVKKTIVMKPDTVLIALHSQGTQLDLPDGTPGFQGVGAPQPILEAPQGGTNIVSGLGFYSGGVNPRATAIKWMAGEQSLMYDVQINNGGFLPAETRTLYYNTGDGGRGGNPFAAGRWGAQHPSIWVTHGGGGTFANIWSANTLAQGGFYVSDTKTPGHMYEISVEHHMHNEFKFDRVENWDVNAPQTEEEAPSSPESVSFEIDDSKNISVNNYHAYRVTRSHAPFPAAVRVSNSTDIRFRNVRVNAESGYGTCDENGCGTFLRVSRFPYENAIQDMKTGREVREREFAVFDFPLNAAPPASTALAVQDSSVRKVWGGFDAISGAAAGPDGTLYFIDHRQQRIFAWSEARGLVVLRHDHADAANLAVDTSGHLLVQSSAGQEGTVYSFRPGSPADEITLLEPTAGPPPAGARFVLPGNVWDNGEFRDQINPDTLAFKTNAQLFAEDVTAPKPKVYVSPDGSLALPHGRVFRQGPDDNIAGMDPTGWRWSNNLDAYGFIAAPAGRQIYVVSGAENRTYRATVKPDGSLGDLQVFADRGGESVVADGAGNVYVANGQVFVYASDGKAIGRIDVPERPIQLVFGGPDRRTLFILAHHTIYAVRTKASGS
jgi:sugar lactone lactonase YvrE